MRRFSLSWVAAVMASLSLGGCWGDDAPAPVATHTVVHAAGTSEVPVQPKKVIVFDTAALDTMDALGIPVAGVPRNNVTLPPFLRKYQQGDHINAGGLFEPDFQGLSAEAPDLIIGGGRAKKAQGELSKIAPTLDLEVDDSRLMASLRERTLQIGEIFGRTPQAEAALTTLEQAAAAVRTKSAAAGTALVVMINGGRMSAYGPGTRFGYLYDGLGFRPALDLPEKGLHGNPMSFELLLQADPDWLFVISRDAAIGTKGAAPAEQVLDNEIVARTKARQAGRIVYLDSAELYVAGGLQTLLHLTQTVEAALSAPR
ncbi:siderophore ABC transporter substrate-binding protein [Novispirillum itersonii]|uniref:siderophore ABC transporter substrate-binding protein n=1 Tax=Novispirillum itersonii TaxID=189 RepID=UPI0003675631|nr:siderophore ABC transporter substrate-binding protein [Novispirillum itersonii]